MNTKLIFAAIVIVATIGMTTPAILDSAFADKGGEPNGNAGLNPFKSCEKHPDQKKCPIPDDDEDGENGDEDGV